MRRYKHTIFVIFLSVSLLFAADGKKYGQDITLVEKTKVSEILSNPESFVGKKVLIEGLVVDVCKMRGCWMELASDQEYQSIRIKVNDGEIVFPMEAKGETALVEGEVYSFTVEDETECSGKEHAACSEDKSKTEGSEASCCSKDKKVKTIYQIKGLGAVI